MAAKFGMRESETVELKKSLAELKEGIVSVTAILNKHGMGELWFGMKNDGTATGLNIGEKTLRDLSQSIAAHIEPKIYPQVSIENHQGKKCIKVAFQEKDAPYFAYDRVYMRVADEDRQLTVKELEHLILIKNREALRWGTEPCAMTLDDLSESRLKSFLKRAGGGALGGFEMKMASKWEETTLADVSGENFLYCGNEDAVYASYLIRFRIDRQKADPSFVWYNLRSNEWWNFINNSKTGSAQAGANAKILGFFPINLPSLAKQKAIAHILGTLDDKIELNRRMNATLEAMARALFQSWFVDFDPVRAKVDGRSPARYGKPDDTLVSVRAPVGDINMTNEGCCIGRGVAAVRHKSGASSYTYYAMTTLSPHFSPFSF